MSIRHRHALPNNVPQHILCRACKATKMCSGDIGNARIKTKVLGDDDYAAALSRFFSIFLAMSRNIRSRTSARHRSQECPQDTPLSHSLLCPLRELLWFVS